jgi:hypothetical protein
VEVEKKEGVQINNWEKIHRSLYPDVEVFPNPRKSGGRSIKTVKEDD